MKAAKILLLTLPVVAAAAFWLPSQCAHANDISESAPAPKIETMPDRDVAGICLPGQFEKDDATLSLNGTAIRSKWGFKVYVTALYLTAASADDEHILCVDKGHKRLHITMLRGVGAKKFTSTILKNIDINFSEEEREQFSKEIDAFLAVFDGGGNLEHGTVINIDYLPGLGTQVTVDDADAQTIPGDDFYHTLLRLWIGAPLQASIKHGLLGKDA